jgi:hypothetical protein
VREEQRVEWHGDKLRVSSLRTDTSRQGGDDIGSDPVGARRLGIDENSWAPAFDA